MEVQYPMIYQDLRILILVVMARFPLLRHLHDKDSPEHADREAFYQILYQSIIPNLLTL